ncbi:MAG: SufD family Fe-S cluster assembly protein [Bacilli bacterium]|nr:SufD family Fe-S cluster assembly protein [Bacilli bacterium]
MVKEDLENVNLTMDLPAGEARSLSLTSLNGFSSRKITLNLRRNSVFVLNFADFCAWEGELIVEANLLEEDAEFTVHCASITNVNEKKRIQVNVNHLAPRGKSLVSCYGISLGKSLLRFDGCSYIKHGAVSCSTRQEAKAILFDEESQGFCSPALKIDENEVVASHAASVGRVNDDHLFYMTSRGLKKDEAKRLITMGYTHPVLAYYEEREVEALLKALEERV